MAYPALRLFAAFVLSISLVTGTEAQEKKAGPKQPPAPTPTEAEVSYGPHPKQVLSFWKVESEKPTPLLFFIHGGGWQAGNRMGSMHTYAKWKAVIFSCFCPSSNYIFFGANFG